MKLNNLYNVEKYANELLKQKYQFKGKRIKGIKDWYILLDEEYEIRNSEFKRIFKISKVNPESKMIFLNVGIIEKVLHKPDVVLKIIQSQVARAIQYEVYHTLKDNEKHIKIMKQLFKFKRIQTSKKIWKIPDI